MFTDCVESSEITLSNVSWKVKLCKRQTSNGTDVVDFYLQSLSNEHEYWSSDAQATIKLLPVNDIDRILVRKLAKRNYKNTNSANAVKAFISWEDFVQNYVNDNVAKFEIELSTNGVTHYAPRNVTQSFSRVQILLDDVSKLEDFNSSNVVVQGVNWKVHVQRKDYYLGVFLEADEDDFSMGSSYNVTAVFKLLSFDFNTKPLTKTLVHNYRWGSTEQGFKEYLYWDDFLTSNNKYVFQGRAHLLVQFKVADPESLWDVEGNDIGMFHETLPCSKCNKQFGSGEIKSHIYCGQLFCNGCSSKLLNYQCPSCKNVVYNNDIHPIHFGNKQ